MKRKISELIKYIKNFGIKITILHYIPWHFKLGTKISKKIFAAKHRAIDQYLYKNYKDIVDKYNCLKNEDENISKDCPIWIMWWQGYENAPEIVKKCIESILRSRGRHNVILLDSNNVMQYISMPEHILEKYKEGNISISAFSDLIRVTLLAEHGGIWCDATLFMTKEFDKHLYQCKFYGVHMEPAENLYTQCTEAKWSTFLMASEKNGEVVSFCKDLIDAYWMNHNMIIDYFMTDYTIRLAYNHVKSIKGIIDGIPLNNDSCADLLPLLGSKFNEEHWRKMSDTFCFKLSWKGQDLTGMKGENTFYRKVVLRDEKLF